MRRLVGPHHDDLATTIAARRPRRGHGQRDGLQTRLRRVPPALGHQAVDKAAESRLLGRQLEERRLLKGRLAVRDDVAERDDANPQLVDVLALRRQIRLHVAVEAQSVCLHLVEDRRHAPGDVDAEDDVHGVAQPAWRGAAGRRGWSAPRRAQRVRQPCPRGDRRQSLPQRARQRPARPRRATQPEYRGLRRSLSAPTMRVRVTDAVYPGGRKTTRPRRMPKLTMTEARRSPAGKAGIVSAVSRRSPGRQRSRSRATSAASGRPRAPAA